MSIHVPRRSTQVHEHLCSYKKPGSKRLAFHLHLLDTVLFLAMISWQINHSCPAVSPSYPGISKASQYWFTEKEIEIKKSKVAALRKQKLQFSLGRKTGKSIIQLSGLLKSHLEPLTMAQIRSKFRAVVLQKTKLYLEWVSGSGESGEHVPGELVLPTRRISLAGTRPRCSALRLHNQWGWHVRWISSVQKVGFKMSQSVSHTFNTKYFLSSELVGKGGIGKDVGEIASLGKVIS